MIEDDVVDGGFGEFVGVVVIGGDLWKVGGYGFD